jgi:hypothetical protein
VTITSVDHQVDGFRLARAPRREVGEELGFEANQSIAVDEKRGEGQHADHQRQDPDHAEDVVPALVLGDDLPDRPDVLGNRRRDGGHQ